MPDVQGEPFLDELLRQEGDCQLAPAGTSHRITQTYTGVVVHAQGDLRLNLMHDMPAKRAPCYILDK